MNKNPAARGAKRGLQSKSLPAICDRDTAIRPFDFQPDICAAEWLARRCHVSIETAAVHAELFGFGRAAR